MNRYARSRWLALAAVAVTVGTIAADDTGSALPDKEAKQVVDFHNKVRKDVGVGPVKWSPTIAKYAQEWADYLAEKGELEHRPAEGKFAQKYGENIAINASAICASCARKRSIRTWSGRNWRRPTLPLV